MHKNISHNYEKLFLKIYLNTSSFLKFYFFLLVLLFSNYSLYANSEKSSDSSLTSFVNPFIGTSNGGNTFPGALVPWGMLSLSPHNAPGSPSGYIYGNKYFYGFGCVHLSGTGCTDLGSIIFIPGRGKIQTDPEQYKCTYSNEKAKPGYYSVNLNDISLTAKATANERSGILKFTSSNDDKLNILIDVGRNLSFIGGGSISIGSKISVEGYNISGSLCGENNREKVYFYARFSQPFDSSGIWLGKKLLNNKSAEIKDSSIGCWFNFNVKKEIPLIIKVGVSYVSTHNAKENLIKEIDENNFDEVRHDAQKSWEKELSKILVEGGSRENKVEFYTALYHTLIHPNIISDVNGEYPLMGRNGVGKYENRRRYTIFSLWDTYRTLHPLLTLVFPERQSEIIKTMIDMYKESGALPKWEIAGNEVYFMSGDPAAPVIADSYIKGIKDFNGQSAIEAMLKPVLLKDNMTAPPVRAGYDQLLKYGYIPFEQDTTQAWWVWGPASTTLEYCLDDWTISQMLNKLGKKKLSEEFYQRSMSYKNLFDTTTKFIRPRLKNGNWLTPFNPLATEGSGSWSGSGGPGYVEGDAWNYTWFVPFDIPGLIKLFGGKNEFAEKLKECFDNGQFTIGNEPDIAYPYLFTYVKGHENETSMLLKKIIEKNFGTGPGGLPGNDDCGAISAWFVFTALGFYPACPASIYYRLGTPMFDKAVINLDQKYYKGKKFVVEKINNSNQPSNARTISLNGKEITNFKISQNQIVSDDTLIFYEYKK